MQPRQTSRLTDLVEHVEEAIVDDGVEALHCTAVERQERAVGRGQLLKPRLLLRPIAQVEYVVWPGLQGASGKLLLQL